MLNIEAAFSVQKRKKISFFVDFYFLHLRTLLLNIINWLAIDYMAVTRRDIAPEEKTQHLWQQTSENETQKSGLGGHLLWHCPYNIDNHVTYFKVIIIKWLSKYVEYIGFTNIFRIKNTTINNFEMSALLHYNLLISLLSTETLHLAVLDHTEAVISSCSLHPGHLHPVPCLGVQLVDLVTSFVIIISSCNYNKVKIMSSYYCKL